MLPKRISSPLLIYRIDCLPGEMAVSNPLQRGEGIREF
jgi:hypothetical protein